MNGYSYGHDEDLDRTAEMMEAERARRLVREHGQANVMARLGELAAENERLKQELADGVFRVLDCLRVQLRDSDEDRARFKARAEVAEGKLDGSIDEVGRLRGERDALKDERDALRLLWLRYRDDLSIALDC